MGHPHRRCEIGLVSNTGRPPRGREFLRMGVLANYISLVGLLGLCSCSAQYVLLDPSRPPRPAWQISYTPSDYQRLSARPNLGACLCQEALQAPTQLLPAKPGPETCFNIGSLRLHNSADDMKYINKRIYICIHIYGGCPIFLCPGMGPWAALARHLRGLARAQ